MPISVTVPSIRPPIAPERNTMVSPTLKGRESSRTSPAKTLLSDCCAAIPMRIVVSAPPTMSWPTGTLNSASAITSVKMAPARTIVYRTTAACAEPATG